MNNNQDNNQLSISFDDFFADFQEAEVSATEPVTVTATVKKTNVSSTKKTKTVKVDGMKKIILVGGKNVTIKDGAFAKKNVPYAEVAAYYLDAAKLELPAEMFKASASTSGIIHLAYNEEMCIADGAVLPMSFVGYKFVAPEGEQDFMTDVTDEVIRKELVGELTKYKDEAYRYLEISESRLVPVPVVKDFSIPFSESVVVKTFGDDVKLAFTSTKKVKAATEDDEAEENDEAAETEEKEELTSRQIAKALGKELKDMAVAVGKTQDGVLFAIPLLQPLSNSIPSSYAQSKPKVEKYKITPELKIYFGYGEINLFGHPKLAGKTEITEAEALDILKAERPEFGPVSAMTWYKEQQFWFPNYPSSRKGAATPLFSVEGDSVTRLVPRVPGDLLLQVLGRFLAEEKTSGNEVAAAFLYNTQTNSWRVSFPSQEATPVSVSVADFNEEAQLPFEFAAIQMHSHPNMSISFSWIDDRDEVSEGLIYAVCRCGKDGERAHEIDVRVRHDDQFLTVPASFFFEVPEH